MKKVTSSFQPQEIKDVFDLNEVVNEFWHAFPNRKKEREIVDQALQILHKRICNQQDANCWLCQHRWAKEIDNYLRGKPLQPQCKCNAEPVYFNNGGFVMNDFINNHIRQKHYGLEVTSTAKDLAFIWENHIPDEHTGDLSHCMYRFTERVNYEFSELPTSMQRSLELQGFRPNFEVTELW